MTRPLAFVVLGAGLMARIALGQPSVQWVDLFGTTDTDRVKALTSDGAGGTFIAGWTRGDLNGPNIGVADAFVARFDGGGNRRWLRQFGTDDFDRAEAVAPDGDGGVYVVGLLQDGAAFVARFDGDGEQTWIRQLASDSFEIADAVVNDGQGGAYVAGSTWGDLGGPNAGERDAFLARYTEDGERSWLVQFGVKEDDAAAAVALSDTGGVFVAGSVYRGVGYDAFIASFDDAGSQEWLTKFGVGDDYACALAPDGEGGVFVAGDTDGDLGGPNFGYLDAYVGRFDHLGQEQWISQYGTGYQDGAVALAQDGEGGVLVTGSLEGNLGGQKGDGNDPYVARYDPSGQQSWMVRFGTAALDYGSAVGPDGSGGAFVGGATSGNLCGTNAGDWDAIVTRFGGSHCQANCNMDCGLDLFDFLCFQNLFNAGDPAADCDGSGVLDLFDFLCFVNAFNEGC